MDGGRVVLLVIKEGTDCVVLGLARNDRRFVHIINGDGDGKYRREFIIGCLDCYVIGIFLGAVHH